MRDLHRIEDGLADWERIPPEQWNKHQERAAATHGIDTDANRISLEGLALTLAGIHLVAHENPVIGTFLFGWGRKKDLDDGDDAEEKGTKSRTGAAIDAGVDKIEQFAAFAEFGRTGIMTPTEVAVTGLQAALNVGATAVIKANGREPHSSRIGKYYVGVQSAMTVGHGVAQIFKKRRPELSRRINTWSSRANIAATLTMGAASTVILVKEALDARNERKTNQREIAENNIINLPLARYEKDHTIYFQRKPVR